MEINIKTTPEEIAEMLQAIVSNEKQSHAKSCYQLENSSIEPMSIPSIEETLKAKSFT